MTRTYAVTLPLLLLWLIGWIAFSWGAVQDDAFIHLRYADNLQLHHFITYDGVHANYGASSLLYVSALALLRGLTASPDLPHATSSVMHLLLFLGLAALFARVAVRSAVAGSAGLVLLVLLCMPSAVRWLDDGMETVVTVGMASLLAWLLHSEMSERRSEWAKYALFCSLSFLAVLLRIELSLLCVIGFLVLTLSRFRETEGGGLRRFGMGAARSSHLIVGCGVALITIYATMHSLLPDTALAKSHGVAFWFSALHDTASTLGSALTFGIGTAVYWLLTLLMVTRSEKGLTAETALVNSPFPILLAMAVFRGQEIQGVRYFAWTFFFSAVWNILELGKQRVGQIKGVAMWSSDSVMICAFLGAVLFTLPVEGVVMTRVLTHRQATLRLFESQRLQVLRTRRGMASDIGFIGYFSQADLCDLAGLVNGRAAGRLGTQGRLLACAATEPDFVFLNRSQLASVEPAIDLTGWQMCGSYDFTNVRQPDTHYLVVRPAVADEVCRATGRVPVSVNALLPAASDSAQALPAPRSASRRSRPARVRYSCQHCLGP